MARVPIIRIQQFTKGSLSAIGREVDRAENNNRNEDIDKSRSQFNVVVKDAEEGTLYRAWNRWREKHGCSDQKINKTMVAFEGAVLTASPEIFEQIGWNLEDGCRDPEVRKLCEIFLMEQYKYLCEKIGEENILSATIHFDEKTPHMQVYYVPAVDFVEQKQYAKDKAGKILRNEKGSPIYARDDNGKIITERVEGTRINRGAFWAALGGKNSYNQLQTEHYNHMNDTFPYLNLERGQEGSTAEHTSKYQWQQAEQQAAMKQAERQLTDLQEKVDRFKEENEKILTSAEIAAIKEKSEKTLFGGLKNVTYKEFEAVERTAGRVDAAIAEAAEERKKREAAEKAKIDAENIAKEIGRVAYRKAMDDVNRQMQELRDKAKEELEAFKQEAEQRATAELRTVCEAFLSVVQAAKALKYDETGLAVELSDRQSRLIDSFADYGAKAIEKAGFSDLAHRMKTTYRVIAAIKEKTEPQRSEPTKPKERKRNGRGGYGDE